MTSTSSVILVIQLSPYDGCEHCMTDGRELMGVVKDWGAADRLIKRRAGAARVDYTSDTRRCYRVPNSAIRFEAERHPVEVA